MDKFLIQGGSELNGEIAIGGAKNAALPAMAATLLTDREIVLNRIPKVRDIQTMSQLLESIGATVQDRGNGYSVQAGSIVSPEAPYDLVKTMRASSLVLGPLLARTGRARVSLPGGCAIGARPINFHLAGLRELGATIEQRHGYVEARAPHGLKGGLFRFSRITVTGTEDLMMAATMATGETILENCACEPEIVDLANLLTKMGASINGAGSSRIRIRGTAKLEGAHHTIIPDRIEAGTYLVASALLGGDLTIIGAEIKHMQTLITRMSQVGVKISFPESNVVQITGGHPLRAVDILTEEYPGFPTDMQAQWMVMMTQAAGESHIDETIFENRFMHVSELTRMGADIALLENRAIVKGLTSLSGATVMASDLRASACLVIAALIAHGETVIDRVYHIDRGYEKIEQKLSAVGAKIRRIH